MCNSYYLTKGANKNVSSIENKNIIMPFVLGIKPNFEETLSGVTDLFNCGYLMADPKPSNFLKTSDGNVVPVDFGLVFEKSRLEDIDESIKVNMLFDYISGGYKYIPGSLKKEYKIYMLQLDEQLGKKSPLRNLNIKSLTRIGL